MLLLAQHMKLFILQTVIVQAHQLKILPFYYQMIHLLKLNQLVMEQLLLKFQHRVVSFRLMFFLQMEPR